MFKLSIFALAFAGAGLVATSVSAGLLSNLLTPASAGNGAKNTAQTLPPADYAGQWWTHPNGCEYSRAGRPGEEVWYLMRDDRNLRCTAYLVRVGFRDAY